MAVDLAQAAKQKKIRYFLISFVDLFGVLRAKLVPAQAIAGMQEDGAGFAAFAAWLDSNPAEPDMLVKPDPATLIQLPWKPEVGWLAGDCWMNGEPMPDTPRLKLKSKLDEAKKKGYRVKTGVEAEYFIVSADGTAISDPLDTQAKPCYDQAALMRRYDVVSEICDAMLSLGWGPYQNDHEDANGQFEMNWDYDDALITADRHVFFKYMVKSLAEKARAPGHVHAEAFLQPDRQRLATPMSRSGTIPARRTSSTMRRASSAYLSSATSSSAASSTARRRSVRSGIPPSTATSGSTRRSPSPAPPGRPIWWPTAGTTARPWCASPTRGASSSG